MRSAADKEQTSAFVVAAGVLLLIAASETYGIVDVPKNRSTRQVLSCGSTPPSLVCRFSLLFVFFHSDAQQREPERGWQESIPEPLWRRHQPGHRLPPRHYVSA